MFSAGHANSMENFTDNELVSLIRENDSDAFSELVVRYLPVIRAKASSFYKAGLETDDLLQEGMLGLLSAARSYKTTGPASFKTYAGVCINHKVLAAYRAAARQKHLPLNNFVSLSDHENQDTTNIPFTSSYSVVDPEALLISREELNLFKRRIEETLSETELKVLSCYLSGRTYEGIAGHLHMSVKSVDNSLQRVRRKLKGSVSDNQHP